jgi:hypothetical protein
MTGHLRAPLFQRGTRGVSENHGVGGARPRLDTTQSTPVKNLEATGGWALARSHDLGPHWGLTGKVGPRRRAGRREARGRRRDGGRLEWRRPTSRLSFLSVRRAGRGGPISHGLSRKPIWPRQISADNVLPIATKPLYPIGLIDPTLWGIPVV